MVRHVTHCTRIHDLDAESATLCYYFFMLCAERGSIQYLFYSLRFELTIYRTLTMRNMLFSVVYVLILLHENICHLLCYKKRNINCVLKSTVKHILFTYQLQSFISGCQILPIGTRTFVILSNSSGFHDIYMSFQF